MNEQSKFVDTVDLDWRETPSPGVHWKKLFFDRESGRSTVLIWFEPGAAYTAHRHTAGEEYFVLEGSLEDGGRTYVAGTYIHHPPGSIHAPTSKEGCVLFISLPGPIEPVG